MSTTLLYNMFGIRGYEYRRTDYHHDGKYFAGCFDYGYTYHHCGGSPRRQQRGNCGYLAGSVIDKSDDGSAGWNKWAYHDEHSDGGDFAWCRRIR